MPIVRLSGQISSDQDENRKRRAKLLYRLFYAGFDIYNGNGDQTVSLFNIQRKIIESDAFVFTPGATLEDMFKAISIFVGYQTLDPDLKDKPTVVLNSDQSWDSLFALLLHLKEMGTVSQDVREFIRAAGRPKEVAEILSEYYYDTEREASTTFDINTTPVHHTDRALPEKNICVFCSASIKEQSYLDAGYQLGKMLAENGYGCISGAGKSGIMGTVVAGSHENGGFTAGSNVPHIIELEGLPDGIDIFWPRPDIYTRMEVMIEHSQGFIIMPGGAGTIQELLAMLILIEQDDPRMKGKPIVVVNKHDASGAFFWAPLIPLLWSLKADKYVRVVNTVEEAMQAVKEKI